MSILTDLQQAIVVIKNRINGLSSRVFQVEKTSAIAGCSVAASDYSTTTDRFLTVTYTRPNGTISMRSVLSNLNSGTGLYMQRTETYYDSTGNVITSTIVYSLTYNSQKRPTNETVVSVTV